MEKIIKYLYQIFYVVLIIAGLIASLKGEKLSDKNVGVCFIALGIFAMLITNYLLYKKMYKNLQKVFLATLVFVIVITGAYELTKGHYVSGILQLIPALTLIVYGTIKIIKDSK